MQYYLYKGALYAGYELLRSDLNRFAVYCDKLMDAANKDPYISSVDMLDISDYFHLLMDPLLKR